MNFSFISYIPKIITFFLSGFDQQHDKKFKFPCFCFSFCHLVSLSSLRNLHEFTYQCYNHEKYKCTIIWKISLQYVHLHLLGSSKSGCSLTARELILEVEELKEWNFMYCTHSDNNLIIGLVIERGYV